MEYYSIDECIKNYVIAIHQKLHTKAIRIITKSILAGMMIAIGASASSVAAHSIPNVGLSRLIAGIVFPVGLMMIILLGGELFTGDCMLLMGINEKGIRLRDIVRILFLVYVGNFIGSIILTLLISASGQLDYSNNLLGAYTIKVAVSKCNISVKQALASGIICNILVCAAVLMAGCAKDVTGKLLSSFFVILAFVTSGFEHCVANMYYITAGLICKQNDAFYSLAKENYNLTDSALNNLNIKHFIINNLLPVTIGNIVGAVIISFPLYYMAKINKSKDIKKEVTHHDPIYIDRFTGTGN